MQNISTAQSFVNDLCWELCNKGYSPQSLFYKNYACISVRKNHGNHFLFQPDIGSKTVVNQEYPTIYHIQCQHPVVGLLSCFLGQNKMVSVKQLGGVISMLKCLKWSNAAPSWNRRFSLKMIIQYVWLTKHSEPCSIYSFAWIIWPSLTRTFRIIRTIVCFPIDSIAFDVWVICTSCLIRTKFSRFLCKLFGLHCTLIW